MIEFYFLIGLFMALYMYIIEGDEILAENHFGGGFFVFLVCALYGILWGPYWLLRLIRWLDNKLDG